jgi:hypothetical protein
MEVLERPVQEQVEQAREEELKSLALKIEKLSQGVVWGSKPCFYGSYKVRSICIYK